MCGIVGGFTDEKMVERGVTALRHRGPDAEGIIRTGEVTLGHTRLAILDLDPRSDQPFVRNDLVLCYNGELWNYRMLREELRSLGHEFQTTGDTEVVAAALQEWGTEALPRMEGMFALAWTADGGETLFLARDRFGEIPLHVALQRPFLFASEVKGLLAMRAHRKVVRDVAPGHLIEATASNMRERCWYDAPTRPRRVSLAEASRQVRRLVEAGAAERTISDVPVCTLLSGGVDSAAVAWCLKQVLPNITAYVAVYSPTSRDVRSARLVADALEIDLAEIKVPLPSADDLSGIVRMIEMPHKAQVEIGWACLKLAEAMRTDGFKVTFSGEGSDELWASYGFAYHALKDKDWHLYRKELYLSQHRKNFARCNKIFMAHSVECRLPFLHRPLAEYAFSLPRNAVQVNGSDKAVLQRAFADALPRQVIERPKVAFQDGMGLKKAIAGVLPNPGRFYRAEYRRLYC